MNRISEFEQLLRVNYFDKQIAPKGSDIKAIAARLKIDDLQYAYELAEMSWTMYYRHLFNSFANWSDNLRAAWDFYKNIQPSYNQSNSIKRKLQQYSTPGPVALAASYFVMGESKKFDGLVFEPSAGTGLFIHPYEPEKIWVNELDAGRLETLQFQGFQKITNQDATEDFPLNYADRFDAVISNPPFGDSMPTPPAGRSFYDVKSSKLEHWMCANALECMKDDGRATLIIGGWTHFDDKGWIRDGRTFFNWLYKHYFVADIINIGSQKLYNKQGTAYPVRLILIHGRKAKPFGYAPLKEEKSELAEPIEDIFELFNRIKRAYNNSLKPLPTMEYLLQKEIDKMNVELKYN